MEFNLNQIKQDQTILFKLWLLGPISPFSRALSTLGSLSSQSISPSGQASVAAAIVTFLDPRDKEMEHERQKVPPIATSPHLLPVVPR